MADIIFKAWDLPQYTVDGTDQILAKQSNGQLGYILVSDFTTTVSGSIILTNGAIVKDTAETAISFGKDAGVINQGSQSVAIGDGAGYNTQGNEAVAVGKSAGNSLQGAGAVAIGIQAGDTSQGASAIAIGKSAGQTSQATKTIIINATGTEVNGVSAQTSSFYVAPIRNAIGASGLLQYNTSSKEVTYNTLSDYANDIAAASGGVPVGGLYHTTGTVKIRLT